MSVEVELASAAQVAALRGMSAEERVAVLRPYVNDERVRTLEGALRGRTRHVTVGLENIFHSQNASAVLRSCDCFGIQDVTLVENSNSFDASNGVARGAFKWLTYHRFEGGAFNTPAAYEYLRSEGYRIVAASPHPGHDVSLYDLDVREGKIAVIFGAEKVGLSGWAMDNADVRMAIPMYGMTESLNISASAAIVVSYLRRQMEERGGMGVYGLTEAEKMDVYSYWLLASIRDARGVLKRVLKVE